MLKILTHKELIKGIERFIKKTGTTAHSFGEKYFNDSAMLIGLKNGRDPRLSTVIKIVEIIKDKI